MEINGTNYCNNKLGNLTQIPGSIASVATGTFQGRQGVQLIRSGSVGGMSVVRTYIIHEDKIYILMKTTLTNTTASTLSGVYRMHNVDPDNNQTINGSYTTRNTIISQPGTSGLNYAQVEAYQAPGGGTDTDGSVVSFFADDERSKVTHGGFSNRDSSDIYTGAGVGGPYYQTVGTQRTEDKAISLAFNLGDFASGQSMTINYAYNLAEEVEDIVEVIESINTSVCGDGTLALSESCDDVDTDNGDGCSATCEIETDYECSGEPSVCINTAEVCGNGLIEGAEVCDDDNTDDEDGCSSSCEVEEGFTCDEESPSVCTGICGDGLILGAEECDDENTTNGDGCSSLCEIENRYACTGEPSTCTSTAGGRSSSNSGGESKTKKITSTDSENSSVDDNDDKEENREESKKSEEESKEKKEEKREETKKEKTEDQYAAEVRNDDPLAPAFVPRHFVGDDLFFCNESDYIAKRREKLSQQSENQVYNIPQEYQEAVDEHKRTYLNKLLTFISSLSGETMRQRVIEEVVCKIETKKAKDNKKHEHTGYGSTSNVYEYLLQYTQDIVILERK